MKTELYEIEDATTGKIVAQGLDEATAFKVAKTLDDSTGRMHIIRRLGDPMKAIDE